jgi:hypothetical protein
MANNGGVSNVISDGLESLKLVSCSPQEADNKIDNTQVARLSWQRNLTAWLYVPVGILIILLACFGINSLIGLSTVSFPASVAVLVVLFFALIIIEVFIGDRKARALLSIIDVPVSFVLF